MKTYPLSVCEALTAIALIVILACVTVPTFGQESPPLPYDDLTPPPVPALHIAAIDSHLDIAGLTTPASAAKAVCPCGDICECESCDCNASNYQVQFRVCRPGDPCYAPAAPRRSAAACASCGSQSSRVACSSQPSRGEGPLRRIGGPLRRAVAVPLRLFGRR